MKYTKSFHHHLNKRNLWQMRNIGRTCCGAIKPSAFRALKLPKTCVETSFFARFQAFGMDLVRDEWRAVLSCYEKKHTSSWVGATVPDSRVI